jgi:hypothetical protein
MIRLAARWVHRAEEQVVCGRETIALGLYNVVRGVPDEYIVPQPAPGLVDRRTASPQVQVDPEVCSHFELCIDRDPNAFRDIPQLADKATGGSIEDSSVCPMIAQMNPPDPGARRRKRSLRAVRLRKTISDESKPGGEHARTPSVWE